MKNHENLIDQYIIDEAEYLAEEIAEGRKVEIRTFYRAEDDEYEVTICDEPSEEGEWEEVDHVDTDYIAESDAVAELLAEWEEDAEARRDPYGYNGVSHWDFY